MRDRRAVASDAGLTGAPDESGARRREQGLARAGNARVRRGMIQLAWRFLMFQRESTDGPTAADARNVMVEGASGILAISPGPERPLYEPSKRRLTWPNDDVGMRLGADPRTVVTTTPRPAKLIRDLVRDPICVVTRGSSYENRSNLAPAFFDQIIRKYEGTRLGRQELDAELLEDTPGALWSHGSIEASRLRLAPDMTRVVVAIDPAVTSGDEADETGIIVAGKDDNGHGYVLADLSGRYPPIEWARLAITAYRTHRADRIVAEVNNGGDMVGATLRMVDPNVAFTAVRASRGKVVRAEPVAALYQQGRVHHIGTFPQRGL